MTTADDSTLAGDAPTLAGGEPTLVGDTAPMAEPDRHAPARLRDGERLGRYTILGLRGQGGMGMVYAAYDPQLDRRVAVKVLRTHGQPSSERARKRLLREAMAMAKLSHPNVVAVHDAGTVDDEVFVAMEFVDGPTLEQWLEGRSRATPEIMDVFVQAGRGLAAAHAAGMVHRDFKPANVLIDGHGRAQVTDFGLVRTPATVSRDVPDGVDVLVSDPGGLTEGDGLLGTPAYMAPEQHMRGDVDARADQFAFCVALYEALYGVHPFAGDTLLELMSAVSQGRRRPETLRGDVPTAVRRAVHRGLERDPAARFPDMNALLERLRGRPSQHRRLWVLAGVGIASMAAASVLVTRRKPPTLPPPPPCAGAGDEIDAVWSPARREAIALAFGATGEGHAASLWDRSAMVIDGYARRWRASAQGACEANRVREEQSDSLFDLRRACLERRLDELDARLEVLAGVDAELLDRSFALATELTPVEVCEDTRALAERVPLPEDPERAAAVRGLQEQLMGLKVQVEAGRASRVVEQVDEALERADALGYAPLRAEARVLASAVHEDLGHLDQAVALLREAALHAGEGRDDRLVATAWVNVVELVGHQQARGSDAALLEPVAEAALARASRPNGLVVMYEQMLGSVRLKAGDREQARAHYLEALVRLGDDDADALKRARLLNNIAVLRMQAGENEEAEDLFEQSLAARHGLLRPDHPEFGDLYQNLSTVADSRGEHRRALELIDRGLRITRAAQPEGGPRELTMLLHRTELLLELGRVESARQQSERAMAMAERVLDPGDFITVLLRLSRGEVELVEGRVEQARATFEQAYAQALAVLGPEHPHLGLFVHYRGMAQAAAGKLEAARRSFDDAIARLSTAAGDDDPMMMEVRQERADLDLRRGDVEAAREGYARVIEVLEGRGIMERELALAQFGLARCLGEGEVVRARELARGALAVLRGDEGAEEETEAVEAWLEEHRP